MKSKGLKKVLMLALAASLVAMPVMPAGATGSGTTSGSSSSSSSSGSKGGSSGSGAAAVAAPSTSEVKLADGTVVKSTITGSYSAKNVGGIVVATPKAAVNAAFGVKAGQQAYVTVADSSYGPQAQKCVQDAAAALGAQVGPVLDIFAGVLEDGKLTTVGKASRLVEFKVSVPAGYALKAGYEYAVIRVEAGGAVTVLPNWGNAGTISFFTDSFGVFAITQVPAGTLDNMKAAQYSQANGL